MRIRTHVFMFLEIAYNRTVLGRVNLTDPARAPTRSSRSSSTAPPAAGAVAVYDADAGARAVSVEVSEADVASVYQPEAHWRFGFAARCGERYDAHVVDSLSIRSAAFVGEAPAVAVRVANNGQQFSTAAGAYSYYAPPEVSSISPNSGPTSGATVVRITGAQLAHGAAPYCRFAQAVGACAEGPTAAFDTCSDLVAAERVVVDGLPALECVSPDGLSEATLALEVTLNGVPAEWPGAQDFTTSTVLFDAVPPPNIAALSPSCGPTDGATQVNLDGRGCRGLRPAVPVVADGTEREHAPRRRGERVAQRRRRRVAAVLVAVGGGGHLGGRRLAECAAVLAAHARLLLLRTAGGLGVSPTTGPSAAPPSSSSMGRGWPTTTCDVVCKFGETVVAGVAIDVDGAGAIRCEAPPAAASSEGALMPLEVSLNRQQYSTGSATFTRYAALANLTAVLPGSGPTTGGTDLGEWRAPRRWRRLPLPLLGRDREGDGRRVVQ